MEKKEMRTDRSAKWDNIKFLMILCVVIGHTLAYFYGSSHLAKSIYLFIYLFHMPMFVFVSGMFSQRIIKENRYEVIIQFLLIYVVMQVLDVVGAVLCGSAPNKLGFHFFWSDGPEWYALALAAFYAMTMLMKNYNEKYIFIIFLFLGCVGGLDSHLGDHYASMRICTFYPVFLAGYYTKQFMFRICDERKKTSVVLKIFKKLVALLLLAVCFVACYVKCDVLWKYKDFLKGKVDYIDLKINHVSLGANGVLLRLLCYVIWMALIVSIVFLVSEKERIYTWLGKRTQSVFVWHKLILVMVFQLLGGKAFFKTSMPNYYVAAVICVAGIITVVTSYLPDFRMDKNIKNANRIKEKEEK